MKSICLIIHQYANPVRPYAMNFVQQLAWTIRDKGIDVTVISPLAVNVTPKYLTVPYHVEEITPMGNKVDVYFPKTLSLGQSHYIFGKSPVHISTWFMEKSADKILKRLSSKPEVLYGHFLAPSGITVARLGRKYNIPSFFASGEAHDTIGQFGVQQSREELETLCGVIAVSSQLKRYLSKDNVVPEDKIKVIPNGFNSRKFHFIDKLEARKYFGLPEDEIIVAFVGAFNERKGILRVCEAVERCGNVKLICAGLEDEKPYGKNLLLATHLETQEVPLFLNAADMFVLPTLAEGCSNAIVEALACGLPVISSNLPFNDDILDNNCSIRINPRDVDEIASAIKTLADDDALRKKMSKAAFLKASELTLDERANKIIAFIDEMAGLNKGE